MKDKDYIHFDWHISKEDGAKMTDLELHDLQNEFLALVEKKGFNVAGLVHLEDDSELHARLDYGDEVVEEAANDYSADHKHFDELNYDKYYGFKQGADLIRKIIDERYR